MPNPKVTPKTIEIDIGNTCYLITTDNNLVQFTEQTDADGNKKPSVNKVTKLDLSKLPDIKDPRGQSIRLYYLGYLLECPKTKLTEAQKDNLEIALSAFQEDLDFPITGAADNRTLEYLQSIFGA